MAHTDRTTGTVANGTTRIDGREAQRRLYAWWSAMNPQIGTTPYDGPTKEMTKRAVDEVPKEAWAEMLANGPY